MHSIKIRLSMIMRPPPTCSFSSASSSILTSPVSLQRFLPSSIIKRYNSGGRKDGNQEEEEENVIAGDHVRAPSLADEFRRLEAQKLKEDHHLHEITDRGIASQTAGKAMDGLDDALDKEDNNLEPVKNRYKEQEPGADYRRRGTNTNRY